MRSQGNAMLYSDVVQSVQSVQTSCNSSLLFAAHICRLWGALADLSESPMEWVQTPHDQGFAVSLQLLSCPQAPQPPDSLTRLQLTPALLQDAPGQQPRSGAVIKAAPVRNRQPDDDEEGGSVATAAQIAMLGGQWKPSADAAEPAEPQLGPRPEVQSPGNVCLLCLWLTTCMQLSSVDACHCDLTLTSPSASLRCDTAFSSEAYTGLVKSWAP